MKICSNDKVLAQITKIKNERGDIIADIKEIDYKEILKTIVSSNYIT